MTTSPLIIPVARFFNISGGAALAGGKVYTYAAGTNTPQATYTDFGGLTPNANPVILDSSGQANIWLNGNYKINLLDSTGVQQPDYPVDNVASISTGTIGEYAVTTGSANAYILTPFPTLTSYIAGTGFNIKVNATNTGASTINISGLGIQNIVLPANTALVGGELLINTIHRIIYDGTNFQLLENSLLNTIAAGTNIAISNGVGSTIITNTATSNQNVYTKGQIGAVMQLTDGATITPDFSAGNNFAVQLAGNRTLANPINITAAGQSGQFSIYQDATGSRTLAYAWGYVFTAAAPSLSLTGLYKDELCYDVQVYNSGTVTITIAAPGVITFTAHGLKSGDRVQLTTTGALPTGLTASTTYWVVYIDANTFSLATSLTNAAAGTKITTTGSQSGVQTCTAITINANLLRAWA